MMRSNFQRIGNWSGIALGIIFLTSAAAKGTDLVRFWRQIETIFESFGLPPTQLWSSLAILIALSTVLVEFTLGAMLIARYRNQTAIRASLILLFGFTLLTFWAMVTGSVSDCGCFGALLKRSPREALFEDILMMILAIVALFNAGNSKARTGWIPTSILISGLVWTLLFYKIPPSWSALRTGMEWNQPDIGMERGDFYLLWTFDPDCFECQSQVSYLNIIVQSDYQLIALTGVSVGKVQEFIWDFEPLFDIENVKQETIDRMGFHLGSLVALKKDVIQQVWHPKRLPEINELKNR